MKTTEKFDRLETLLAKVDREAAGKVLKGHQDAKALMGGVKGMGPKIALEALAKLYLLCAEQEDYVWVR